jgi:hypothetical protein
MNREEIKNNLYDGDYQRIADMCKAKGIKISANGIGKFLRRSYDPKRGEGLKALIIAEKVALENKKIKDSAEKVA